MSVAATNERWLEVEHSCYSVAHKFVAKYGGDFDEYVAQGHELFMKACERWKPERGKFNTYFVFLMNCEFIDPIRKFAKNDKRLHRIDGVDLSSKPEKLGYSLSEDADAVIRLALEMPADIRLALAGNDFSRRNVRGAIKEFLVDVGWTPNRVKDTFSELKEALS